MSVLTQVFLLMILLPLMIHCAPNKKPDDDNVHSRAFLRPRQNGLAFPDLGSYTGFPILPSGLTPLSNNFATGTVPFVVPTGTANTGASSGAAGYQPFPTDGAPYHNDSSAHSQAGSYPFATAPNSQPIAAQSIESAASQVGQSAIGNQCQSPKTVTLPIQIVTSCAQTVTITAAPPTVTISPPIQTQTVTVIITITAGPAPAYPDNTGSPQPLPITALPNLPPPEGPNASATASVPPNPAFSISGGLDGQGVGNLSLATQVPAPTGGQPSDLLPSMPSGQDVGNLSLGGQISAPTGGQASDATPSISSEQGVGNLNLGGQVPASTDGQVSDLLPSIPSGQDVGNLSLGGQLPAPTSGQASDVIPSIPSIQGVGYLSSGSQLPAPTGGQVPGLFPSISSSQHTGSLEPGSQTPVPTGVQMSDLSSSISSGQDTGSLALINQLPTQMVGQMSGSLSFLPSAQVSGPGMNAAAPYPTNVGFPATLPAAIPPTAPFASPNLASASLPVPVLPPISAIPLMPPTLSTEPGGSGISPSNVGHESILDATPSITTNGKQSTQASSPPVIAPSVNSTTPFTSGSVLGQASGAPPILLPSAPYQNATGPLNGTAPRGSGSSGTIPRVGPTGSGFLGPTGGPNHPSQHPLPSKYSIQIPPSEATQGTLAAGATIQIILPPAIYGTPTPLPSTTVSQNGIGPNFAFHEIPAGSTPRPMPPINHSDVQGPPLSPFSVGASCSLNNTSYQNITANYENLHSSSPDTPLLYLGLNYTSFTLSPTGPNPSQIMAQSNASPKSIAILAPFVSFRLNSLSISCTDNAPPANCNVHISALGITFPDPTSVATTGLLRTVLLDGTAAQKIWFDASWTGLTQVNFTAESNGTDMAVGLGELCYEILSAC